MAFLSDDEIERLLERLEGMRVVLQFCVFLLVPDGVKHGTTWRAYRWQPGDVF